MPSNDPAPSRQLLLEGVLRRGRHLRRRRQAGRVAAGVAAVALVAFGVPQLADDTRDQRVVADSPATTERDRTPTSVERGEDGDATPPPPDTQPGDDTASPTTTETAVAPSTTTPPASTPTTTAAPPSCRNSADVACGPAYWDPPPGPNEPLTVEVVFTPSQPQPGDEVVFRVTATDPDARIDRECNSSVSYGDGRDPSQCVTSASCVARYGPWTPPDRVPDRYETTYTHRYEAVGDFTARFSFQSKSACYDDPYGSRGEAQVIVRVGPAA